MPIQDDRREVARCAIDADERQLHHARLRARTQCGPRLAGVSRHLHDRECARLSAGMPVLYHATLRQSNPSGALQWLLFFACCMAVASHEAMNNAQKSGSYLREVKTVR